MSDHTDSGPVATKDAGVDDLRSQAQEHSPQDRVAQSEFEASLDAALRLVSEQSVVMTRATGSAIALKQGQVMFCRARAGTTAPELGAQLDGTSGLSGECVRTGRLLICHDTESDPRVDLAVCRLLGIRSMVVMPLYLGVELIGVFEVFSSTPSAFGRHEISVLESMGELIVSVVEPAPEVSSRASDPTATPVIAKKARSSGKVDAPEARVPASPAPLKQSSKTDAGDDLICEIEAGNVHLGKEEIPASEPAMSGPLLTGELIQRNRAHKPILAGILLLGGLLGFGWWIRSVRYAKTAAVELEDTPPSSDPHAATDSQGAPSAGQPLRSDDNQASPKISEPQDPAMTATDSSSSGVANEGKPESLAGEPSADVDPKADGTNPDTPSASVADPKLSKPLPSTASPTRRDKVAAAHDIKTLRSSAESGDPDAQLALAVRYANGDGVKQSYGDALKWFSRAEAQGALPSDHKALDAEERAQAWAASR